jgi:hypothetical protein
VEEKISLSERFGLWISFYPFSQDEYLAAIDVWLAHFGVAPARSARESAERARGDPVRAAARLALGSRRVAVRQGLRRREGARLRGERVAAPRRKARAPVSAAPVPRPRSPR